MAAAQEAESLRRARDAKEKENKVHKVKSSKMCNDSESTHVRRSKRLSCSDPPPKIVDTIDLTGDTPPSTSAPSSSSEDDDFVDDSQFISHKRRSPRDSSSINAPKRPRPTAANVSDPPAHRSASPTEGALLKNAPRSRSSTPTRIDEDGETPPVETPPASSHATDDEDAVVCISDDEPVPRKRHSWPQKFVSVPVGHVAFAPQSRAPCTGRCANLLDRSGRPAKKSRLKRNLAPDLAEVRKQRRKRLDTNLDQEPLSHESRPLRSTKPQLLHRLGKLSTIPNSRRSAATRAKRKAGFQSVNDYQDSDDSDDERLAMLKGMGELNLWKAHTIRSGRTVARKLNVAVRVPGSNIVLHRSDFACLRGLRWLNDELVNAFGGLLNERNRKLDAVCKPNVVSSNASHAGPVDVLFSRGRPRAHMLNSFFYARLAQTAAGYDYAGVRRWTRRAGVDVLKLDLVLIPVHVDDTHWVLVAVDLRTKELIYFDSLGKKGCKTRLAGEVLENLAKWLVDEVEDKHGEEAAKQLGVEQWNTVYNPSYAPKQLDCGSCGVFVLYTADYLAMGKPPSFKQKHVDSLRKRTCLFLVRKRLADCPKGVY